MMPPAVEAGRVLAGTFLVTPSLLTKRTFFFGKLLKIWPKRKPKESLEVVETYKDSIKELLKKPIEALSSTRWGTKQKRATPRDVSLFKVEPKAVNSIDRSKVSVVKSGYYQHERLIHSFLNTHYWPREPCVLGLRVPPCSSYLQGETKRFMTSGDRWLAIEGNGEKCSLIGVLVAQKTYPWQAGELEWTAQSNCLRPEQKHLYFRAHTLRSSNLFQKYSVPYIYNIEVLATDRTKNGSDGIAELLLHTSIMHAFEMRHPITMIVAKSKEEADICEKMGMTLELSMNDDEYVDPTGKRLFFPRLPDQTLNIYIRKMEITGSINDDIYSPAFIKEIYEDPGDIFEKQEEMIITNQKKSVRTTDNPFMCDNKITKAINSNNSEYYKSRYLGKKRSEMSSMPNSNLQQNFNITSVKADTCIDDPKIISILDDLTAVTESLQYSDSTTCNTEIPMINDSISFDTKINLYNSTPGNTKTLAMNGQTCYYNETPDLKSLDTKTPYINHLTPGDTNAPKINNQSYYYYEAPVIDYSTFLDTKTTKNYSTVGNPNQKFYYTEAPVTDYSIMLNNRRPDMNYSTSSYNKPHVTNDLIHLNTKTHFVNDSKPGNTNTTETNLCQIYNYNAALHDPKKCDHIAGYKRRASSTTKDSLHATRKSFKNMDR